MVAGPATSDLTRSFVAVPCGRQLAAALSSRLDAAAARAPVRFTSPHTWHLTLQFLGDWPPGRLAALCAGLAALDAPGGWELAPAGWGGFPDLRRPRVLFLQFRGAEPLVELACQVRRASAAAWPGGPQDTRPAHPHLTLARLRVPLEPEELNRIRDIRLDDLPPMAPEHFALLSSELLPQGARHTERAVFRLRKKGE